MDTIASRWERENQGIQGNVCLTAQGCVCQANFHRLCLAFPEHGKGSEVLIWSLLAISEARILIEAYLHVDCAYLQVGTLPITAFSLHLIEMQHFHWPFTQTETFRLWESDTLKLPLKYR